MKTLFIFIFGLFLYFGVACNERSVYPEYIETDIRIVDSLAKRYLSLIDDTATFVRKFNDTLVSQLLGPDTACSLEARYTSFPDTPLVDLQIFQVGKADQSQQDNLFNFRDIDNIKLIGGRFVVVKGTYDFEYKIFRNDFRKNKQPRFFLEARLVKYNRKEGRGRLGYSVLLFNKYYN